MPDLELEHLSEESRTYAAESFTHDTPDCPRCGGAHMEQIVTHLYRPIRDHEKDLEWAWRTTCPVTGDPVLIANRPEDESTLPPTLLSLNAKESRSSS